MYITLFFFLEQILHMSSDGIRHFFYSHHGHGELRWATVVDFAIVTANAGLVYIDKKDGWKMFGTKNELWILMIRLFLRLLKIYGAVHEHIQHLIDERADFVDVLHELKEVKGMLMQYLNGQKVLY